MAKHQEGSEPFDVTMPEGFELGARRTEFEAAAKQADWTVEHDGATIVVRDVWTDNEDHAAWLVASKGRSAARKGHRLGGSRGLAHLEARRRLKTLAVGGV